MTKSLSKFLLSMTVTPLLVFGTPAILATSAHADSEVSVSDSSDGGWFGDQGDGGNSGSGDSGWGDGDGWGSDNSNSGSGNGNTDTDCGDTLSRC
jgi:hypothetical protein